jgi:hypothetical protein
MDLVGAARILVNFSGYPNLNESTFYFIKKQT